MATKKKQNKSPKSVKSGQEKKKMILTNGMNLVGPVFQLTNEESINKD